MGRQLDAWRHGGWRRPLVALFLVVCLTFLLLDALESPPAVGDPVVFRLTTTHGLHRGDLPSLLFWLVGVVACAYLGRPRRSRR